MWHVTSKVSVIDCSWHFMVLYLGKVPVIDCSWHTYHSMFLVYGIVPRYLSLIAAGIPIISMFLVYGIVPRYLSLIAAGIPIIPCFLFTVLYLGTCH